MKAGGCDTSAEVLVRGTLTISSKNRDISPTWPTVTAHLGADRDGDSRTDRAAPYAPSTTRFRLDNVASIPDSVMRINPLQLLVAHTTQELVQTKNPPGLRDARAALARTAVHRGEPVAPLRGAVAPAAVGDALLIHVAEVVTGTMRQGDMFARLGGDEFAAVLFNADERDGAEVATRILRALDAAPFRGKSLGVSIGIASDGPDSVGTAVLAAADAAMYRAKRKGGQCYVLSSSVDDDLPPTPLVPPFLPAVA
jgi:Diguanylate cyclase, GGDEF domain